MLGPPQQIGSMFFAREKVCENVCEKVCEKVGLRSFVRKSLRSFDRGKMTPQKGSREKVVGGAGDYPREKVCEENYRQNISCFTIYCFGNFFAQFFAGRETSREPISEVVLAIEEGPAMEASRGSKKEPLPACLPACLASACLASACLASACLLACLPGLCLASAWPRPGLCLPAWPCSAPALSGTTRLAPSGISQQTDARAKAKRQYFSLTGLLAASPEAAPLA